MSIFSYCTCRKINSADCVDMDCDGHKKNIFKDLDGSLLNHIGHVISQSEFDWDTNPQRGLGDYRIPKEMVTDDDGTRIPYDTICPNKGTCISFKRDFFMSSCFFEERFFSSKKISHSYQSVHL